MTAMTTLEETCPCGATMRLELPATFTATLEMAHRRFETTHAGHQAPPTRHECDASCPPCPYPKDPDGGCSHHHDDVCQPARPDINALDEIARGTVYRDRWHTHPDLCTGEEDCPATIHVLRCQAAR